MYYCSYFIAFLWPWSLDIETEEYKKAKENRDEIRETHSSTSFIDHRRN